MRCCHWRTLIRRASRKSLLSCLITCLRRAGSDLRRTITLTVGSTGVQMFNDNTLIYHLVSTCIGELIFQHFLPHRKRPDNAARTVGHGSRVTQKCIKTLAPAGSKRMSRKYLGRTRTRGFINFNVQTYVLCAGCVLLTTPRRV